MENRNVFSHDYSRAMYKDTYIGKQCFIGVNAIIMCGIHIGDSIIVASGIIETKNILSNRIVVGNPPLIIKENVQTNKFGQLM